MAIADWIREATERRRQRTIAEVRSSEEYRQSWWEGYDMGYEDADKGRPRRRSSTNGTNRNGNSDNGVSK